MDVFLTLRRTGLVAAIVLGVACSAFGQQMVFQFNNPSFRGQRVGSGWMLQTAKAQKNFDQGTEFGGAAFGEENPLDRFQQDLQRRVLQELSSQVIQERFNNVDLSENSSYDFGNFRVDITPGTEGINIRVFNALTGAESTITIPRPE